MNQDMVLNSTKGWYGKNVSTIPLTKLFCLPPVKSDGEISVTHRQLSVTEFHRLVAVCELVCQHSKSTHTVFSELHRQYVSQFVNIGTACYGVHILTHGAKIPMQISLVADCIAGGSVDGMLPRTL